MDLFRVLASLFSNLGIPTYLADCVPDQSAPPYMTMDCQPPFSPRETGSLTLTLWSTGQKANNHRLTKTETVLGILPPRGKVLLTEGGKVLLKLKGSLQCIGDPPTRGLRLTYELRFIPLEGGTE